MQSADDDLDNVKPSSSDAPEFTLRAVLTGLLIGCLLCFTNLYFGLQSGWISMMSLQSALIGYLISLMFSRPISPQENVILQTTAVATGTMPLAAGFVGIIPALSLLNQETDGVPPLDISWLSGIGWSMAVAFFGVFLAAPLRKQVIIKEELAFPSGTATAQLISVLHNTPLPESSSTASVRKRAGYHALAAEEDHLDTWRDEEGAQEASSSSEPTIPPQTVKQDIDPAQNWKALIWSFAASGSLTVLAYFIPVLFVIPLFGTYLAREWAWYFSPSLSYVGQGIIMGFPTTVSMAMGMVVGWAFLSPLSRSVGWAPGPVGDMTTGARGWILWVALAVMCADNEEVAEDDIETPHRLVPIRWVGWGLALSIVFGTLLVWIVFGSEGIKPWATVIGFLMGLVLSVLGVRALGETDLNPVSGLGKISQLLFAVLQPGNVIANIIAGGVAEAGAQQAGDLMQDLKTGHLLRASPRAQFYGQLIGSALSIFVTTTAFSLYTRAYTIPGPEFPAPTAYVWLSLARLLRDGSLPDKSKEFMILFAILFAGVAAAKTYALRRNLWWSKWVPSGIAFAIGFLNTPSFTLARLIGGIVEHVYHSRFAKHGKDMDITLIIIASGFVLGEGVVSILALIFKTLGIKAASCIGCSTGLCSGCS
ncbi:oligopeptide transporter [Sistotremastrum suecicum HHB10207 ss-3]|uniref:Oligopeptide transporter n=1 Tax=Sistotremastrum suecicum HHB10207 ss-3 TaxID=1314776 RepID=A0A166H227_9AGAM|nr:oligopeptide transporter [Sistotremastrum suecicum HHB10207 ss-3]